MKFFKTTYQECDDEDVAHLQYQLEFLRTFEIESYDDNAISMLLDAFSEEIKTNESVMSLLCDEKEKHNFRTLDEALFILFSWDNLHRLAALMTSL